MTYQPKIYDIADYFNGAFVESFDALVSSDGVTITLSVNRDGGGDLTMWFSNGTSILDCTPAATVSLTAGTDTVPQGNYVYIPRSTKVLTVSTTAWASEEHIKVAYILVQSAGTVQSEGALINQNWNDHSKGTDGQGHVLHMAERSRRLGAVYYTGGADTFTIATAPSPDEIDLAIASATIYQMHKQTFPAFDTASGDKIIIPNHPSAAYTATSDLETQITNDATGTSLSNKYFNIVVWGCANKGDENYSPVFCNLPTGSYNSLSDAINDVSTYDVYTIPDAFVKESSTGFLLYRYTLKFGAGTTTVTLENTTDLRGSSPLVAAAGGGSSGGDVATDTIWDAKGDLAAGSGADTAIRVAVGTDGQFLKADSAASAGMSWDTIAGGGDLLSTNNLSDLANATTSRQNLGVEIGVDVQAYSAALDAVSGTNTGDEPAASTTVAGISELATQAEVDAGVVDNVVTASTLAGSALQTKVDGVEAGATADQTDAEIETAYNSQVAQVSAPEKTAGTEVAIRRFSPLDIADMASTHGGGAGEANTTSNQGGGIELALTKSGVDLPFATLNGGEFSKGTNLISLVGAGVKTAYEGEPNTNPFTDAEKTNLGNQSGTNTGDEPAASTTVAGISELATSAEIDTGADNTRTITPLGLAGSALQTKVDGVEAGATADQTDAEIETGYNNQVAQVSAGEKTAGTETAVRRFSPKDVADMAGTHGGGGGGGEANTASNAGGAGVGVFDGKVSVDLEFRNLVAASSAISIALDAANKEIDIDVVEANLSGIPQSGVTDLVSDLAGKAAASHTHTLADITDSGALAALATVGTAQVDDEAVTYAKMQHVTAAARLLGRGAAGGAGDVEEVRVSGAIEFNGGELIIGNNGIQETMMANDSVGLDQLSATGTPSSSNFLRGDNTWATPSGSSLDPVPDVFYDGAGGQTMNSTTAFTVNLDTRELTDSNYTLSADIVTIVAAGTYVISFCTTMNANANVGTTRGGWESFIEAEPSGGGGYSLASRSLRDTRYWRESAHYTSTGASGIYVAAANDKIRLRTRYTEAATAAFPLVADYSWVAIHRIA